MTDLLSQHSSIFCQILGFSVSRSHLKNASHSHLSYLRRRNTLLTGSFHFHIKGITNPFKTTTFSLSVETIQRTNLYLEFDQGGWCHQDWNNSNGSHWRSSHWCWHCGTLHINSFNAPYGRKAKPQRGEVVCPSHEAGRLRPGFKPISSRGHSFSLDHDLPPHCSHNINKAFNSRNEEYWLFKILKFSLLKLFINSDSTEMRKLVMTHNRSVLVIKLY